MRRWRIVCLMLVLAAVVGVAVVPAVRAEQLQHANVSVRWAPKADDIWRADQDLTVRRSGHSTFWAMEWDWAGTDYGGYTGLQTGNLPSERGTAIFSIWNAKVARQGSCERFAHEGRGMSCKLRFRLETDVRYRLRVWRLEADAGGQWWGAWVQGGDAGLQHLGDIRVDKSHQFMVTPTNFTEYFGQRVPCDEVPVTEVLWMRPRLIQQGDVRNQYSPKMASARFDSCANGNATHYFPSAGEPKGAIVRMGGQDPTPPTRQDPANPADRKWPVPGPG